MAMSKESRQLYQFGPFSLDAAERLLLKGGDPVPLTPKTFDLLLMLVENSGRLLGKTELMESLWPGSFVEEANLPNNISLLRRALGDDASEHNYIETVPKRGYRFVAKVVELTGEAPDLVIEERTRATITLEDEEKRIGEDVLRSMNASRELSTQAEADTESILTRVNSRGKMVSLALTLLVIISSAIAIWVYVGREHWFGTGNPFQPMRIQRLTTTGKSAHATISPDGKYVAYVKEDSGKQSLWIRQAATTSNVSIVPPADVQFLGLTFSTDGNYIYYTVREGVESFEGALYQVPLLGGASRKILVGIDTPIAVSPDGRRFAFIRASESEKESALIVANTDGTERQVLAKRTLPSEYVRGTQVGFVSLFSAPSWSPDGKRIVCAVYKNDNLARQANLVSVSVADGTEMLLSPATWVSIGRLAWISDGSGLIVAASVQLGVYQLWYVSFPGGEAKRITDDPNSYYGVSLTSDSKTLTTVQTDVTSSIWVVQPGPASQARQITPGKYDGRYGVGWSPDGRVVYQSFASGNDDIWIMNADGTGQRQLTFNPGVDDRPSVTPDGRYIVFNSERTGRFNIWRMTIDGNDQVQLTTGANPQI